MIFTSVQLLLFPKLVLNLGTAVTYTPQLLLFSACSIPFSFCATSLIQLTVKFAPVK